MDESQPAALVDGMPATQVSVTDRGLNYGDGVFRTIRVAEHKPIAWTAQMARLAHDCQRLYLPPPDAEDLYGQARRLFTDRADGVLKIVMTRGSGGRGYAPPETTDPVCLVSAHAAPPAIDSLDLAESSIRLAQQPALAGVKHLNRLEQVLARAECMDNGWADALMLDTADYVIGTTMRNIVLAVDGQWMTPELSNAGVAGATRARIMDTLACAGHPVEEAALTQDDCCVASAMVACNSVSGVTPVNRLGANVFHDSIDMAADCNNALLATMA